MLGGGGGDGEGGAGEEGVFVGGGERLCWGLLSGDWCIMWYEHRVESGVSCSCLEVAMY